MVFMQEEHFKKIVQQYLKGSISRLNSGLLSDFEDYFQKDYAGSVFKSKQHKRVLREQMLARIQKELHPSGPSWWNAAAAILVVVAVGLAYYLFNPWNDPRQYVEISTQENQVKSILLSDSTQVVLNHNSVLRFPKKFTDTTRSVFLQGEAYFNVRHNPSRAFYVLADGVKTSVLGTEFTVRTRDQSTSVALIKGSVLVTGLGKSELLHPKQKISLDYKTAQVELKIFDPQLELFWKDQQLVFDNQTLDSIVKILESKFNKSIQVMDPTLLKVPITGTFKGKGITTILLAISKAADFSFRINDQSHIILYRSNYSDELTLKK